MKWSSGWPRASPAGQPKICSAARLKARTRCSPSTAMMASIADSTMPAKRSRATATSAALRPAWVREWTSRQMAAEPTR